MRVVAVVNILGHLGLLLNERLQRVDVMGILEVISDDVVIKANHAVAFYPILRIEEADATISALLKSLQEIFFLM